MAITFSPVSPVDFGNVVVGQLSSQKQIQITNSGNAAVSFTTPAAPFSWDQGASVSVPARSAGVDGVVTAIVTFGPTAVVTSTGSLTGSDGTSCSLTGKGVRTLFAPPSLDFGTVAQGQTATKSVTMTNSGSAAVSITAPTTGGFSWDKSSPLSLGAGASVTAVVTFAPTTAGSSSSTATGDDGSSFSLAGTAVALTFSPPSIDFGSLVVNASTTDTIKIKNSSGAPLTVAALSGVFAAAATTVPARANGVDGSADVTVTFTPSSAKSFTGSLAVTGSTLSGTCALLGSGRDAADQFETEGDSTETGTGGGSPGTAGNKYYEILVPNFALNSSDSTPGTSFLRIGNFNPSPPTSTGSGLTGEGKSWQLANLVGDPQAIQSAEPQQDLAPDAYPTTPSYNGDPNYLLGFCDDTRYRQGDSASSWSDRRDETKKLLTKGGWWDHSDGNRISTTAGDKIEVIQGNYKMLVLGRLDSSSPAATIGANALITDISGGLMAENGPSPTHCIKSIEFSQTERGTWEVYQNNGVGHVFSSFYGDTVDIFLGPHKATWTGDASGYTPSVAGDKEVFDVYKKSLAIRTKLGELTSEVNPAVLDHMYASRVLDYKRIDGDIKSDVQANNLWSKTYAKFGSNGQGGQIQSDTIANTITSTTTAASITSTNFALNNFAFTFGIQEAINIGAILDVQLGPKSSINIDWMQFNGLKHVVSIENAESAAAEQRLVAIEDDINGIWTDLTAVETRINEVHTELSEETTALSNDTVHLGVTYEAIFAEVDIM